jgi:hypothetical protein
MSTYAPTAEQVACVDAFRTGRRLAVVAGAGAGKTSTLELIARSAPRKRGLYVAFNKSIAGEAMRRFPAGVTCKTIHGLAYGSVGVRYKNRLNGARVPAQRAAIILGINEPFTAPGDLMLQPKAIARLALDTVVRFCRSADDAINVGHVPTVPGMELHHATLAPFILPYANLAWADMIRTDGNLAFGHDVYLKIWALRNPVLPYDYLLVDEAQDLNPVVEGVVNKQRAQLVLVGDPFQSIYAWRGSVDAMANAAGARLYLSQSFRFGPEIAREANKWLEVLGADLRLTGHGPDSSIVAPLDRPDAVLCRSNAGALARIMREIHNGTRVALVGGGKDIQALAYAAVSLMEGRGTDHPELMAFRTWHEVQDYAANDSAGSDLRVLVNMIDQHGPETIIDAVDGLCDEHHAAMVVSTAHKAKGREWGRVEIADDFRRPTATQDDPMPAIDRGEAMLAYVAVTRAKDVLDPRGLAWVNEYVRSSAIGTAPAVVAGKPRRATVTPTAPVAFPHCPRCGDGHDRCKCDPRRKQFHMTLATPGLTADGLENALADLHAAA